MIKSLKVIVSTAAGLLILNPGEDAPGLCLSSVERLQKLFGFYHKTD